MPAGSSVAWKAWWLGNTAYRRFTPQLGAGGGGGGGGGGATTTVYFGRDTDDLLDATQVQSLPAQDVGFIYGSYSIPAGDGFMYLAFTVVPHAIMVNGFPVAFAGPAQGYLFGVSPLTYDELTIGGDQYFVFRSYFQLHGSLIIDVS